MTKLYRILGKRGRITIPFEIRQRVGFSYNDVLSFIESPDGRTVTVKREKICDNCSGTKEAEKDNEMTLEDFLDSLSAEQQRVALARALIVEPKLCLLDEPLSNLDAALRVRMRGELKRLQQELGTTMVFVTHDQEEALILADSIAVMSEGELLQLGSAEEVFRHPANDYIASFLGLNDIVWKDDGSVLKVIRHGEKE